MSNLPKRVKRNQAAVGTLMAIGILAVLVIGGGVLLGVIQIPQFQQMQVPALQQTQVPGVAYSGPADPAITGVNSLNIGTTYVADSAFDVIWLRCAGCSGVPASGYQPAGKNNNQTLDINANDNGVLFIDVTANAVNTFYQDIARTLTQTGRVEGFAYVDYDNDVTKEFVYRINAKEIRSTNPGQARPNIPFVLYFLVYQTPTFSYAKPTASPETGIGTSANLTRLSVEYTFANFDRAVMLKQFVMIVNGSNANFQIKSVQIPIYGLDGTGGTISFSQSDMTEQVNTFTASTGATVGGNTRNNTYTFVHCTDIACGQAKKAWLYSKTGDTRIRAIDIQIEFTLNSNDIRFVRVGADFFDDDQATGTGRYTLRYFKA